VTGYRRVLSLGRTLTAGAVFATSATLALGLALGLTGGSAGAQDPHRSGRTYVVIRGDTLWSLAAQSGDTVGQLAKANRITDPNHLKAGTRLVIPPPTKTPAKATPAKAKAKPRQVTTSGSQGPAAVLRRHPERLALVPAFRRAATADGLPTTLLEAVDWQESGWQNQVVSSAHAVGVGQVMPNTIRFVNQALAPVVLDPSLASSNIAIGAWYLGYLLRQSHGNQRTAVASYYQGPTSVQAHGLQSDTRRYVTSVMSLQHLFAG